MNEIMKTKKELKEEYKQKKPITGVFQVKNMKNGMVLLEGATNVPSKWNRHRTELRFGSHRNKKLQEDWNLEGEENFSFSVVSELEIKDDDTNDLNDEVKLLLEMVEQEMGIAHEMKY